MNRMKQRLTTDQIVEGKYGMGEREQLPVADSKPHKGTKPFGKLAAVYRKIAPPIRKHLKALGDG